LFPDDPADVAASKNRYNAAVDQLSTAARSVAAAVSDQAEAAHASGGIEMLLSVQQIAGVPLSASLVVFLVPPSGCSTLFAWR